MHLYMPFKLNDTLSGIETTKRVDYLASKLGTTLCIRPKERVMHIDGSDIDSFIFDNQDVALESLITYLNGFIENNFIDIVLEKVDSRFNKDKGILYIIITIKDLQNNETATVSVPVN